MVFDEVRNRVYAEAIDEAVFPGCRVLDLGAGLGIHGLLAAAAGAQEVILLDVSPVVELADDIASANGLSDRIRIVRSRLEEAELDTSVDVLISVFTGNFLLTEDLLPSLFVARDRFLKPGGRLLPGGARMWASLVQAPDFHKERIGCWSEKALGLGFDPIRSLAANRVYYSDAETLGAEPLTKPSQLMELDFASARSAACRSCVVLDVEQAGTCHGILGWFDIQLGERWLSTGPSAETTHWSLAFLPLDPPLELKAGAAVSLELDRPEFGEWTWTVAVGDISQRHSTFHGRRLDLEFLRRQKEDYVPVLGAEGEMALYVLKQMEQGRSVVEILNGVLAHYPRQAALDPGLRHRVRQLVERWAGK